MEELKDKEDYEKEQKNAIEKALSKYNSISYSMYIISFIDLISHKFKKL